MTSAPGMGKALLLAGLALAALGGLLMLLERAGGVFRLPGDIVIERRNFTFYFPLATSVVLSLLLTLVLWLMGRK